MTGILLCLLGLILLIVSISMEPMIALLKVKKLTDNIAPSITKRLNLGTSKPTNSNAGSKAVNAVKKMMLNASIAALRFLIDFIRSCGTFLISIGGVTSLLTLIPIALLAAVVGYVAILSDSVSGGTISGIGGTTKPSGDTTVESTVDTTVDTSSVVSCCKSLANWYIANIDTYCSVVNGTSTAGGRKFYSCDLYKSVSGFNGGTRDVGDDCSSFAAAYASLVSGVDLPNPNSKGYYLKNDAFVNAGWAFYTVTEIGGVANLLPGDILVCSNSADSNSKGNHVEIYLGSEGSFGWGKVQDKCPSNTSSWSDEVIGGETYACCGSKKYGRVYRYTGKSS